MRLPDAQVGTAVTDLEREQEIDRKLAEWLETGKGWPELVALIRQGEDKSL